MNLNLGSGPRNVEGYLCIDKSPRLLLSKIPLSNFFMSIFGKKYEFNWDREIKYKDVRRLKFAENSISFIYSSHLLEHLYLYEAKKLLENSFRILKPGGVLRLALPDYHDFISQYILNSSIDPVGAYFTFESSLLSWPLERQKFSEKLISNFFGKLHVHKWHPTSFVVTSFLHEIGFEKITEYSYQIGNIPNLGSVENRDIGTFYVEATKPFLHLSEVL